MCHKSLVLFSFMFSCLVNNDSLFIISLIFSISQFFGITVSVLIQFNCIFNTEAEMEGSRSGPLQLISVEIIFDIHG